MTMLIIVSILMAVLPPPGFVIAARTQEQEQEESQLQVQDLKNLCKFDDELQSDFIALSDTSSGDDAWKDPSIKEQTQDQEELWDIGAGLRVNYLRLTGGISGFDAETGNKFDIDYSAFFYLEK